MIATIRFKDILKYLVITTILIGIFVFIARFFFANKKLKVEKKEKQYNFLSCLNIAMPITKTIENNKVIVADNKENKRNDTGRNTYCSADVVEQNSLPHS